MSDSPRLQNRRYGSSEERKRHAGKKKERTELLFKSALLVEKT
jgi:hypothetical protein